jgi:hypothetical protein
MVQGVTLEFLHRVVPFFSDKISLLFSEMYPNVSHLGLYLYSNLLLLLLAVYVVIIGYTVALF